MRLPRSLTALYGEQGDKPSVETTLVLRGKVGDAHVEELPIQRRAPPSR